MVTWDLKVKQMGLQKKELSEIMVDELQLSCTPEVYLKETEKLHHELFPDVRFLICDIKYISRKIPCICMYFTKCDIIIVLSGRVNARGS